MSERGEGGVRYGDANGEGAAHAHGDYVCDHYHDDYITEKRLGDVMSRWALKWVVGAIGSGVIIIVWALALAGRVTAVEKSDTAMATRMEEIRREGSLPVQQLKSDISNLTLQLQQVSEQLRETKALIERVAR